MPNRPADGPEKPAKRLKLGKRTVLADQHSVLRPIAAWVPDLGKWVSIWQWYEAPEEEQT